MLTHLLKTDKNKSLFAPVQSTTINSSWSRKTFSSKNGFTLVEVMVVVVIISLLSSFVILNLQGRDKYFQFENEAQRLSRLISLAREQAILNSEILGLRFRKNCYSFMLRKENEWKAYNDRVYGPHEIAEGIEFELLVNNILTTLPADRSPESPQIYILSSGEISSFQLNIKSSFVQSVYTIIGHETGNIEMAVKN